MMPPNPVGDAARYEDARQEAIDALDAAARNDYVAAHHTRALPVAFFTYHGAPDLRAYQRTHLLAGTTWGRT